RIYSCCETLELSQHLGIADIRRNRESSHISVTDKTVSVHPHDVVFLCGTQFVFSIESIFALHLNGWTTSFPDSLRDEWVLLVDGVLAMKKEWIHDDLRACLGRHSG
ncbi:hypothetical protein ACHAXS_008203, partial [Conticribra weissflogii]